MVVSEGSDTFLEMLEPFCCIFLAVVSIRHSDFCVELTAWNIDTSELSFCRLPGSSNCNVLPQVFGLTSKFLHLCRARKALKLAQQLGVADKISYSTLINGYGKGQDFPNMEATLWEMQNAGFGGSLEAHNSMLDAYGKAGQLEKLEDALVRMEKSGFRKDLQSYNVLINTYGRRLMIAEMEDVFNCMQVSHFYI